MLYRYVRVSDLARAYVGLGDLSYRPFRRSPKRPERLHKKFLDKLREDIRVRLLWHNLSINFYQQRRTGNIIIRGKIDGLEISESNLVSLVEFKTYTKPSEKLLRAAKFQLQVYAWILRPVIERKGWTMSTLHYLRVVSEKGIEAEFLVPENPEIEKEIWSVIAKDDGIVREIKEDEEDDRSKS